MSSAAGFKLLLVERLSKACRHGPLTEHDRLADERDKAQCLSCGHFELAKSWSPRMKKSFGVS